MSYISFKLNNICLYYKLKICKRNQIIICILKILTLLYINNIENNDFIFVEFDLFFLLYGNNDIFVVSLEYLLFIDERVHRGV